MATNADRSEETRQALLYSAIEIIEQKGYAKTTLDDIAKNIGMTRGAFYWHFKNKKEILLEIEKQYEKNYLVDYGQFQVLPSAYETLKHLLFHQIEEIFDENYIAYSFIIRYRIEALTELPDLVDLQARIDEFSIQRIAEQVARGVENGEFREDINAYQDALGLFTFIVGVENVRMLHTHDNERFGLDHFKAAALYMLDSIKK